jgi:type II secretory ATPase GspE/PulE/Tfp pilus assembly ATPase PilB-like protein
MSFELKNPPPQTALRFLPQELMVRYSVIPVDYNEESKRLTVAMADIYDYDLINDIQVAAGVYVNPVQADEDKVIQWISAFAERAVPAFGMSGAGNKANSPVIRMVNEIISEAMHTGVSDIHFEPGEKSFIVRFRKDGVLKIARKLPLRSISEITSRIKIMASIDIAEKRRPQDGRIHFDDGTKAVDIRVSVLPTDYGQKMVLRLLDKGTIIHRLDSLGMTSAQIALCDKEIHKPYGMFLITGPTGSGKTTTLYTLLQMIQCPELNISTIEEPIEYKLDGITQTAVNTKIDLTFAAALRTLLRQDPDVIMVGEIRDSETAELAIRAALTGHLVFSTLHTNDAPSAIVRLIDMGVEPFLVASAVNFIMAQRLVRKVCPKCGGKDPNCLACGGSGYKGRVGIFEMMPMTETIREMVHKGTSNAELRKTAIAEGMKTLAMDGAEKVALGLTTESEIAAEAMI